MWPCIIGYLLGPILVIILWRVAIYFVNSQMPLKEFPEVKKIPSHFEGDQDKWSWLLICSCKFWHPYINGPCATYFYARRAEYGRYSYAISVIALIVTFSQLGLPTLILRETAQAYQLIQWAKVGGLTRWSMRVAILIAFASSVSVYFYTLFYTDIEVKDVVDTVSLPIIALLLPPVIVALNNRVAILRGLQRVVVATILQRNVSILFVVIGVLIFLFIFNFAKLSADQILCLELLGFLIALCLAFVYVRYRATELYQQNIT